MTFYHGQYKRHRYAPMSDLSSHVYSELDWFWASNGQGVTDDFVKLHFNRQARVYLLIPVHKYSEMSDPTLPGWNAVGPAVAVKGLDKPLEFGVHQKYTVLNAISEKVYVFSKEGSEIVLPHHSWVWNNLKGFKIPNMSPWIAMVSEKGGETPKYPPQPHQVSHRIRPNRKCPTALHDLWVTPNTDSYDPDTAGKLWKTWHPAWDPMFWWYVINTITFLFLKNDTQNSIRIRQIKAFFDLTQRLIFLFIRSAYDHEHGSSSVDLMGYYPKYDYTPWKNNREDEANAGFKNLIARQNGYTILYMIHVQTSQLRRVTTRWHSIQVVIQDDSTKEIVAEVTHKGDFGFLSVRGKGNTFIPISEEDRRLSVETWKAPKRRSINVIKQGVFDPRYQYRNPRHSYMMGAYEDWTTVPLCGAAGRDGNVRVDITKSATGIPSIHEQDEKVFLGEELSGVFYRQAGQARTLLTPKFKFSFSDCERVLGTLPSNGVFYTDAKGLKLVDGPGKDAIRQYVKPGLHVEFQGEFRAVDSWTVLMEKESKDEMKDIGYGLDPDEN